MKSRISSASLALSTTTKSRGLDEAHSPFHSHTNVTINLLIDVESREERSTAAGW